MLRNILIAVAAVVVVLLIIIATRSPTYRVSRSTTIAAPAPVVYAQIVDFHRWDAWSPWAKLDPAMKVTYAGPASGPGAAYAWTGNDKVGEGKMLITGAQPNQEVNIKLDFIKPFEGTSLTGFSLEPSPAGTKVTWSMSGENNFVMKAISLVHDMDLEVGKDFERGLLALKGVSETEAKRQADEAARKAAAEAAAQAAAAQAAADAAAAAAAAKPAKHRK
jgi:Polyketide cyclase / dehydrase and lipid transport